MTTVQTAGRAELRNFGLILGALFAAIFGVVPLLLRHHSPLWPWAVAAVLWLGAILAPRALGPLHRGWMRLGLALGWLNTRLVLTLLFTVLIVPLGFVIRLLGRDRMGRKFDAMAESYRTPSKSQPHNNMERPF